MTLTRRLAELDPASPYLPLCQRILAEVTDPILITESVPDCPADAVEQHRRAEAAFSRRDLDVAGTHYRRALHLCPEATSWWTYYGDIWFSLGDFAQAREGYQHSLSLDPCYWPAHRFWADTLLKEGDLVGARDRTAVAVACNPEYDIGWRFLEVITTRGGGAFRWVPVSKPAISDPSDDLPADGPFSGAAGQLYRTSRASAAAEGGSVLQIERSAVERTLAALPGGGDASGPLWQRLSEAQDAGYLDEAIFIFLLDEALLAEFLEYRSENLSRLSRYITEQLAPL